MNNERSRQMPKEIVKTLMQKTVGSAAIATLLLTGCRGLTTDNLYVDVTPTPSAATGTRTPRPTEIPTVSLTPRPTQRAETPIPPTFVPTTQPETPTPTRIPEPTRTPVPTGTPTPTPTETSTPETQRNWLTPYEEEGGIPYNDDEIFVDVAPDAIEVVTGGRMTVRVVNSRGQEESRRFPGGKDRGTIVMFVNRTSEVVIANVTDVPPGSNHHGDFRPLQSPEQSYPELLDKKIKDMQNDPNCLDGKGCDTIDYIVLDVTTREILKQGTVEFGKDDSQSQPTPVPAPTPTEISADLGEPISFSPNEINIVSGKTVLGGDVKINGLFRSDSDHTTGTILVIEGSVVIEAPWGASGVTGLKDKAEMDVKADEFAKKTLRDHPEMSEVKIYYYNGAQVLSVRTIKR